MMTGRNVHPSHPDHPHNRLPPALTRVVDARPVSHSQLGLFGEQGDLGSRVFTPAGLELHSAHMLAHGRQVAAGRSIPADSCADPQRGGGGAGALDWWAPWGAWSMLCPSPPFLPLPCREPPLTTRTDSFEGCLDYIFLTPGILKVAATLPLPYQYDAAQHMEPGQVRHAVAGGGSAGTGHVCCQQQPGCARWWMGCRCRGSGCPPCPTQPSPATTCRWARSWSSCEPAPARHSFPVVHPWA